MKKKSFLGQKNFFLWSKKIFFVVKKYFFFVVMAHWNYGEMPIITWMELCLDLVHGQSSLEIMVLDHKFFFIYFIFYLKRNDAAPSQSLTTNLTQPKLTFPPTNNLCPQLNLNHLPLGCQPCMLPLSHTLPSEKTPIFSYKNQRLLLELK